MMISPLRLSVMAMALILLAGTDTAKAELKDGADVPRPPSKEEDRRPWTVSGEERFYLPTLDRGPGKGYFAFYEARGTYRGYIRDDGGLEIEMIDRSGDAISERFQLGGVIAGRYTIKSKQGRGQSVPRYMLKTKEEYEPMEQPRRKVTIEAILEDGAEFKRSYDFDRDKITVVTGIDCKNDKPTSATMGAWFPRIMTFDNMTPQSEREDALKGHSVEMRHVQGRKKDTVEYPYAKSVKWGGVVDEVKVKGPWGKRRSLELKTRNPIMRPYIYSGQCPYEGYRLYINVPHDTYSSFDYKLDIKFDD